MTSEEIPVIDFRRVVDGKFESGSSEWRELTNQVIHACQTNGLFRVLYDHIPDELYKDIFSIARDIYELPVETRKENKACKPFLGYYGKSQDTPLYESLVVDLRSESLQAFVELIWPGGNLKAFETLESFHKQLAKMDLIIRQMILEGLGFGNLLESMVKNAHEYYNLIKYVPPSPNDPDTGLAPHRDFHFFTMLFQDDVGGLEYQSNDGSWNPISPLPGSFIVILGYSFKAWSNGRLEAPMHKVVVNRGKERFSFSCFISAKDGVPVEAPEELVDSDHPRVFPPMTWDDFVAGNYKKRVI